MDRPRGERRFGIVAGIHAPDGVLLQVSDGDRRRLDMDLATALRYIRQHACRGLTVKEVLQAVPMSRSALEQRMKKAIGCTPKAEVIRLQLERVKELLRTTDLPLADVAARAGYEYPQYMAEVFRKKFGLTPRAFRRGSQGGKV